MRDGSLKDVLGDFAACVGFFTRLPMPSSAPHRPLATAIWAAPLSGLAVGLAAGGVLTAGEWAGLTVGLAAGLALAVSLLVTGALHEDGLADVADGFGGGRTRDRKLEIMRDSRIGTYGVAAIVLSLLLRWSAIAALARADVAVLGLVAAHAGSRALLPAFMASVPHARPDGLAAGAGVPPPRVAAVALGIGALAILACLGLAALTSSAIVLAIAYYGLRWLCERQVGGQTGDVLGTLQQLGEVAILAIAVSLLA